MTVSDSILLIILIFLKVIRYMLLIPDGIQTIVCKEIFQTLMHYVHIV